MTRGSRAAALGAVFLSGLCCDSGVQREWREASDLQSTWPSPDGTLLLAQAESGDVLAIDSVSGALEWRYVHFGSVRHPLIEFPRARLVCPPRYAKAGILYLLFSDRLVSLSRQTGRVRWRRPIRTPYTTGMCPAVTPDSGLVLLVRRGHGVIKLDSEGDIAWSFAFPDGIVAHAGPTVRAVSGDVLVRAGGRVFSLDPDGQLAYDLAVGD